MLAAVNRFTEADIFIRPPRKIYIFRSGRIKMSAAVNRFTPAGKNVCHS